MTVLCQKGNNLAGAKRSRPSLAGASIQVVRRGVGTTRGGAPEALCRMRSEPVPSHVRFGSKADIGARLDHVRFAPKSGHFTDCTTGRSDVWPGPRLTSRY